MAGEHQTTPAAPATARQPASTPSLTPAQGIATLSALQASSSARRFSPYPTSLRTSLYRTPYASPYAAGTAAQYNSPAGGAVLHSRVPLLSSVRRPNGGATPGRTGLGSLHYDSPLPGSSHVARIDSVSAKSKSSIGPIRRRDKTQNPYQAFSAPEFDSFVDTLTSTLRSVLEPPAAVEEPTTRLERARERLDGLERKEEERLRARAAGRARREQEEEQERERTRTARVYSDAAAVEGSYGVGQSGRESQDVFGEIKEVALMGVGAGAGTAPAASATPISISDPSGGEAASLQQEPLATASAVDDLLAIVAAGGLDHAQSGRAVETFEVSADAVQYDADLGADALDTEQLLAQHRAEFDALYSSAHLQPPSSAGAGAVGHLGGVDDEAKEEAGPEGPGEVLTLDSSSEEEALVEDEDEGGEHDVTALGSEVEEEDELASDEASLAAEDAEDAEKEEEEDPMRTASLSLSPPPAAALSDTARLLELDEYDAPSPAFLSRPPQHQTSQPEPESETDTEPEQEEQEPEPEPEPQFPRSHVPLFLERATASVTTSEADGEEVFREQVWGDSDAPLGGEEEGGARWSGEEEEEDAEEEEGLRVDEEPSVEENLMVDDRDAPADEDADAAAAAADAEIAEMASSAPEKDEDPSTFRAPFRRVNRYDFDEAHVRGQEPERASVEGEGEEGSGEALAVADDDHDLDLAIDPAQADAPPTDAAAEDTNCVETVEMLSSSSSGSERDDADEEMLDASAPENVSIDSGAPTGLPDLAQAAAEEPGRETPVLMVDSTATTPALGSPAMASYFAESERGDTVDEMAVASGALADVDAAVDEGALSAAASGLGVAVGDDTDTGVMSADENLLPPSNAATMAVNARNDELAGEETEVPVPIEPEIDEANLADVEAEEEGEAKGHVEPRLRAGDAELAESEAGGEGSVSGAELVSEGSDGELPSRAEQKAAGPMSEEEEELEEGKEEGAGPTWAGSNPLEAIYANEDSEDTGARIPYEAKGKGRARPTPSDLDAETPGGELDLETRSTVSSSDDSITEDDINQAIARWRSISDQLVLYDNADLVDKLLEMRKQYAAAVENDSALLPLIMEQLYDWENEAARRVAEGTLDPSFDDEDSDEDGMPVEEEGGFARSQGFPDVEHEYADEPGFGPELGPDGDAAFDEEYETRGPDSSVPGSPDRSAFPDSSPPPAASEDPREAAEREAAEAQLAKIASDLVQMHQADRDAELCVTSAALDSVGGSTLVEYAGDGGVDPYSLYGSLPAAAEQNQATFEEAPSSRQAIATVPTMDFGPTAPAVPSMDFGPADDSATFDPHHAFLRGRDYPEPTQRVKGIEYELARPPRSSSPPHFQVPPTQHRIDSPVTSVEGEGYEQADGEKMRVGVDEEEMRDSTFVGRERPLQTAVAADHGHVREQADLDAVGATNAGLRVVDDDDEDEAQEQPASALVPISAPKADSAPRVALGATPPPPDAEGPQDAAPIVEGVAPPVNNDILPEAPFVLPASERLDRTRTDEDDTSFVPMTGGHDAPLPRLSPDPSNAPVQPFATGSSPTTNPTAPQPSLLNRETATEEITSDSRVPYPVPPTVHRETTPVEDEDLLRAEEFVRVGVEEEEMCDASLVDEALPLQGAMDAAASRVVEQQDTAPGPTSGSPLLVIDDDEEAMDVGESEPSRAPATPPASASSGTVHRRLVLGATPPPPGAEEMQDAPHISNGVAPPVNPDILPTSPAEVRLDEPAEDLSGRMPAVDAPEELPAIGAFLTEVTAKPAESAAVSVPSVAVGWDQTKAPEPVQRTALNRETVTEEVTSDSREPNPAPPTVHRATSPLQEEEDLLEQERVIRLGVEAEEAQDASLVGLAPTSFTAAVDATTMDLTEQQDSSAGPTPQSALTIVDDDEDGAIVDPVASSSARALSDQTDSGLPLTSTSTGAVKASATGDLAESVPVSGAREGHAASDAFPAGVAAPQNPDILPEVPLDTASPKEPDTPLRVTGVEEPGEWDPSTPIRIGGARAAGTSEEDSVRQAGREAPKRSESVAEVDTEGEGTRPTSIESVRGSSVATDDEHHLSLRAEVDIDVSSVHSAEDETARVTMTSASSATVPEAAPQSLHARASDAAINSTDFATAPAERGAHAGGSGEGPADQTSLGDVDFDADLAATEFASGNQAEERSSQSDSSDDEEVAALLLSPAKSPARARSTRKRVVEDRSDDTQTPEAPPKTRRSARLSATPAPASDITDQPKRPRAGHSAGAATASSTPGRRSRRSVAASETPTDEPAEGTGQSDGQVQTRPHGHRHHVPPITGSDTEDGLSPPVTRSHCHFQRLKIQSRADPRSNPYLFNIPVCALASEVARNTMKAFETEDLGPVDETDGCEGIQLGGVDPSDAYAVEVMASRHSSLVPHEDVLDAVRRIAGPELWDEGACEVVPLEEEETVRSSPRKSKRPASVEASPGRSSPKKRR